MIHEPWSFACPDWQVKLERGETPMATLPFDEIEAGVAVDLFNKLRIPDVLGQPAMADASGEWFRDIVRAAFGSMDFDTGIRRIGEIFCLVPKKNSKTTNAAALGMLCLLMNRRPNIEGVIIGPTQEVAQKCFDQAAGMIDADPYLKRRFKVDDYKKTITDRAKGDDGRLLNAKMKIKSFDMKVATGTIPAFAIIDELHVMAQNANASRIIGQIRGGMITNPESLLVFITTQSDKPPAGVFKSELQYARGVRDGLITKEVRMLPVLYEFPEEIQTSTDKRWRDTKLWPMVLPNLGRSITLPLLVSQYWQAVEKGIEEEARWASQHLNIEIGLGLHTDRWTGADHWLAATQPGLTLDEILETSDVCTIGIDGGGLDDLMSLVVLGRHAVTKVWQHWARAWADPLVFERRKNIAERLRDFEKQGDLIIIRDEDQDLLEVADICERIWRAGLLPEENGIGLDAFGVATLVDIMDARGIPEEVRISVGQGWKLQSAVMTLPRKLKDKKMRHCGQGLMAWAVGNAKAELKGSNTVITKEAAGAAKIDPLVATFNAAMLMFANPVASYRPSVYETRGIRVI